MYGFKQSFIFERLSEKCKCITLKSYLRNAESSSADTKTIGIRQRSALSCCGSSKPLILGKRTDLGEFGIDLQNAVICVEQNDGFWHSGKQPVEKGPLSGERVEKNVSVFASFPHSGNCSAIGNMPGGSPSLEITVVCAFSMDWRGIPVAPRCS